MPVAKARVDQFVNRALALVTMSAIDTLTFSQIRFAVGIFQGVALVISKVEWFIFDASIRELVAATDSIVVALVTNDNLAQLNPSDQDVIASMHLVGLGANVELSQAPLITDFSSLPGGGIILPANPLFLAMSTAGAAAASQCRVVIYYTFKTLTDKDYIELVQMMVPGNI
ncbi:hypothetical protein ES703_112846 [subsurface metagenome]